MEFQSVHVSQSFFTRYSPEGFVLGERAYQGSLFILPDKIPVELVGVEVGYLRIISYIEQLKQSKPEIILVGTGKSLIFPSIEDRQGLHRQSLFNIEWMDTPAACRTYNVLIGEGRRIAAFFRQCV